MTRPERRALLGHLLTSVTTAPGHLDPADRAAAASGGVLPNDLETLAATIRSGAFAVTDDDVARALAAGHSDDQLFELTVATAVGAAHHRLSVVLRALREEPCV